MSHPDKLLIDPVSNSNFKKLWNSILVYVIFGHTEMPLPKNNAYQTSSIQQFFVVAIWKGSSGREIYKVGDVKYFLDNHFCY